MKKLHTYVSFMVLLVILGSLVGCQQAATPTQAVSPTEKPNVVAPTEAPAAVEPTAAPAAVEPTAAPKKLKIVSLVQPSDNPWVVNNIRFQKAVAEALGIDLVIVNDQGTEDSNISAMESIIAMQPDGILFDPITAGAGVRDAALLEENHIPGCTEDRVVLADINDYQGDYLICQATIDTQNWGYDMMMALINQGSKKIAAIMDPHGVLTVEQAWEGALKAVAEHPDVTILQESWQQKGREQAIATMENYLTKYAPGQIDGVYVFGSTTGLGALYAIQQAGRQDEIRVSTCDIDNDVATLIKDGQLASSMDGHWMLGGYGLVMLYDYLNGYPPTNRQPYIRLISADPTNIDQFKAVFLDSLPYTPEEIRQLSKVYNPDADVVYAIEHIYETWNQ